MLTVYKIKDLITKKEYVGQTKLALSERFIAHKANKESPFYKRKHELELVPLWVGEDEEMADLMEMTYIEWLNTIEPAGYNKMGGGKRGYTLTVKARKGLFLGAPAKMKPIRCIETGQEFKSTTEAAITLKINRPNITRALTGRCPRAGKYHFEYLRQGT